MFIAGKASAFPVSHRFSNSRQRTAKPVEIARGEASLYNISMEKVLTSGSVAGAPMEAVRINHIDLLLVGRHPGHELPDWLSNSKAHELAERVPCDVPGVH